MKNMKYISDGKTIIDVTRVISFSQIKTDDKFKIRMRLKHEDGMFMTTMGGLQLEFLEFNTQQESNEAMLQIHEILGIDPLGD